VDLLLHIDDVGELGWVALRDVGFRSLEIVPLGLPMACAIGITWVLTRAARFQEITAIRCGGIPLRRVLVPVLLSCVLFGTALGFFEDRVLVPAHRSLRGVEQGGSEDQAPQRVSRRWWFARGSWLLSAARFDVEALALEDVTAFLLGPDRQVVERIDARRARATQGGRWELEDAEVRSFVPGGIDLVRAPRREIDLGLKSEELATLREPPLMTLRALWQGTFSDGVAGGERPAVAIELHQRLAHPWVILLLVLLAIPFALVNSDRSDYFARALLQSLGAAASFWTLWTVATVSGQAGWAPPALALWGVMLAFFAAAALRYRAIDS
jgi:lipopolysaccharide export LptBFGC system permease protein LptF